MIQPFELKQMRPMELHNGVLSSTSSVWEMLTAAREGDLTRVKDLTADCPELLTCMYDYTTPLHFGVLQGHGELVHYLVEHKALDPTYLTHPFRDSLITMAADRGLTEMAEFLKMSLADPNLTHEWGDTGKIHQDRSEAQLRFQELVNNNDHAAAEAMLKDDPALAKDELAFWGEGIMMMPAKDGDHEMLELLKRYGAGVPDISKWGARYYFKHYDTAKFLLEHGMNPNHMNWRMFTLLHDMAFTGDIAKTALLIDHGADIDAVDEEYNSTPLGYAARFGFVEIVKLLLERGADPNKASADWATPLAWAEKKGHADIAAHLRKSGAL